MARFKITIEYDGRNFVGWQRQANGLSVQHALEDAIEKLCGDPITVFGAGRTDSGVHATGQVAHFDLARDLGADTVRDALNFHLKPAPVAVLSAQIVDEDFHARFSATARIYRYLIINRRAPLTLSRGLGWWVPSPLDDKAMAEAGKAFIGHHDFTTFRATLCQAKSPVRTLDEFRVRRRNEEIHIHVKARSFLHRQVRNMVGTLSLVGNGKWTINDVKNALRACDRSAGGPTAPAQGLYLTAVEYIA